VVYVIVIWVERINIVNLAGKIIGYDDIVMVEAVRAVGNLVSYIITGNDRIRLIYIDLFEIKSRRFV
jgi:hypothetical protein